MNPDGRVLLVANCSANCSGADQVEKKKGKDLGEEWINLSGNFTDAE